MSNCSVADLTARDDLNVSCLSVWELGERIACYILSARRERRVCRAIRN